jgi:hypothetical protein
VHAGLVFNLMHDPYERADISANIFWRRTLADWGLSLQLVQGFQFCP